MYFIARYYLTHPCLLDKYLKWLLNWYFVIVLFCFLEIKFSFMRIIELKSSSQDLQSETYEFPSKINSNHQRQFERTYVRIGRTPVYTVSFDLSSSVFLWNRLPDYDLVNKNNQQMRPAGPHPPARSFELSINPDPLWCFSFDMTSLVDIHFRNISFE